MTLPAPACAGARPYMVAGPRTPVRGGARLRRRARRSAGFTLLELVLVFALVAMMTAALVLNVEAMVRQSEARVVEGTFWEAARAARTEALLKRRTETLRFDERESAFIMESPGGSRRFTIDRKDWRQDLALEIAFKKRLASSQFTLVRGELVDLREIPSIQFYQDGTCTPFVLELIVGDSTRKIEIDPWTGAELLPDEDAG